MVILQKFRLFYREAVESLQLDKNQLFLRQQWYTEVGRLRHFSAIDPVYLSKCTPKQYTSEESQLLQFYELSGVLNVRIYLFISSLRYFYIFEEAFFLLCCGFKDVHRQTLSDANPPSQRESSFPWRNCIFSWYFWSCTLDSTYCREYDYKTCL